MKGMRGPSGGWCCGLRLTVSVLNPVLLNKASEWELVLWVLCVLWVRGCVGVVVGRCEDLEQPNASLASKSLACGRVEDEGLSGGSSGWMRHRSK
jgi:hypothetical protein